MVNSSYLRRLKCETRIVFPINIQKVKDKIAVIRNLEVIADADVAELYGVETKRINEVVKNNPDKFPASIFSL